MARRLAEEDPDAAMDWWNTLGESKAKSDLLTSMIGPLVRAHHSNAELSILSDWVQENLLQAEREDAYAMIFAQLNEVDGGKRKFIEELSEEEVPDRARYLHELVDLESREDPVGTLQWLRDLTATGPDREHLATAARYIGRGWASIDVEGLQAHIRTLGDDDPVKRALLEGLVARAATAGNSVLEEIIRSTAEPDLRAAMRTIDPSSIRFSDRIVTDW